MKKVLFAIVMSVLATVGAATAQVDADLGRLEEKASRHLENKMPGWKHKRGEPVRGSESVLVDFWSFPNRNVKIAVVPYSSGQKAKEAFEEFMKYQPKREELKGLGDDAYCWGYALSNVTFRRGKYIVYLSSFAAVDSDPDARSLSPEQREERQKSEVRRWSREFAKHMATAIDQP